MAQKLIIQEPDVVKDRKLKARRQFRKNVKDLKTKDTALKDDTAWAEAGNNAKFNDLRAVALELNNVVFALKRYLLPKDGD